MSSTNINLYQQITIVDIIREADGVKTFRISGLNNYEAGQFLTLALTHNGEEVRRSYSFSSSPGVDDIPAFTVKRVENGIVSRMLCDSVKIGDTLNTTGAAGLFTLTPVQTNSLQVFFFAAGVGITPIYSLLKQLLATNKLINVVLKYSNRASNDTIFYYGLQQLQQKYGRRLVVEYLYSTAKRLDMARLNKALLPVLVRKHLRAEAGDALYYLCGPFPYMRMVTMALEELDVPAANIRRENFNTDSITAIQQPPDVAAHTVHLHMNGSAFNFVTQYPDTILKSAKRLGITMPYSCENGICGSCVARCTNGTIWHRNNEVLTDDELASGLVLTCVGYPINGDATIEIV